MDLRKTNASLTIFLLILFASFFTKTEAQDNLLVNAIQLFEEENFNEAELAFKKLLDDKPDHLMVNYYYGASRTENGHYGTNEIIYLLNGSIGESPLKTDYYIGIQYHAQNRWEDALKHYNRYKSKASDEDQKKVKLSEKVQMCYSKQNPFVTEDDVIVTDVLPAAIPREKEIEEYNPTVSMDSTGGNTETYTLVKKDSLSGEMTMVAISKSPETTKETLPKSEPINFIINGEITYLDTTHFQTKKGLKFYSQGVTKEKELDALTERIENTRKQYGAAKTYNEQQSLGEVILNGETEIYQLQSEMNQLRQKAKLEELEYWDKASAEEKEAFFIQLEEYNKANEEVVIREIEYDTTAYVDPTLLLNGSEAPSPTENENSDELIYKIQLGAYSRGLPTYVKRLFDKLSYIRKIENYTDDKGVVVYTTGNLTNYDDAVKMQNQVRQEGVEDAFVVPYFNGKRITLEEAKEIEAGK